MAIAQWGYAEAHLLNIVQRCCPAEGDTVPVAYLSIENFRSKLAFCDCLVQGRVTVPATMSYWNATRERCARLSKVRNKLAHGWHVLYIHGKEGRRFAITPVLTEGGKLAHRDGKNPPKGSLFLKDVVGFRMEFLSLTQQLCNCSELIAHNWKPFSDAELKMPPIPSLGQLDKMLKIELGLETRPPRGRRQPSKPAVEMVSLPTIEEREKNDA